MKIFANIPGFAKLLNSLKYMNANKKVIEDARAAGDFEREREYILKSTSVWGDIVFKMFAKEELGKLPFFGKWIARIRSVFIERDDPRASLNAIKKGIEYINDGFSLVIFPEGTRSRGPDPGPFMKGSTKLATKPGVPIIPISLNGSYRMFEEEGRIRGAKISLMIHEPIETKGMSRDEEKHLSDRVEKIVTDGVRELQAREKNN